MGVCIKDSRCYRLLDTRYTYEYSVHVACQDSRFSQIKTNLQWYREDMYIKLHSIFTTHDKMEINKQIHVSKISFMCMICKSLV